MFFNEICLFLLSSLPTYSYRLKSEQCNFNQLQTVFFFAWQFQRNQTAMSGSNSQWPFPRRKGRHPMTFLLYIIAMSKWQNYTHPLAPLLRHALTLSLYLDYTYSLASDHFSCLPLIKNYCLFFYLLNLYAIFLSKENACPVHMQHFWKTCCRSYWFVMRRTVPQKPDPKHLTGMGSSTQSLEFSFTTVAEDWLCIADHLQVEKHMKTLPKAPLYALDVKHFNCSPKQEKPTPLGLASLANFRSPWNATITPDQIKISLSAQKGKAPLL